MKLRLFSFNICLPRSMRRHLLPAVVVLLAGATGLQADDFGTGPNLVQGDFENGQETYNPWAGVDDSGNLHVWDGSQLAVDDSGNIVPQAFSPSISVGDLNGDGLPDLVVSDARGYFWYFANSGTPTAPAFSKGEIIPLWLGENSFAGDVVPRIQLVDYAKENKLDIVAGNFTGELFFLHNDGTAAAPVFHMPTNFGDVEVPTHTANLLWCNYLAPFLFDWTHTGRLDLTMGDGSYSANSIYLFANQGDSAHASFNENQRIKIIPGYGREALTPQVVDWDNDGKPDIITGDRTGHVLLYLNKAATKNDPPSFDFNHPQQIMFGDTDQVGAFTTVCAADLSHDKLFDLIVGKPDGTIVYSLNTGTLGHPRFGPLIPLKGINPYPKILTPETWSIVRVEPYGIPYQLLEVTNAQREPSFTPPPGFAGKGALKFSMVDPHAKYFTDRYQPQHTDKAEGDLKHNIIQQHIGIITDTRYIVSFWVRADGDISNLNYRAEAFQEVPEGSGSYTEVTVQGDTFPVSSTWTQVQQDLHIDSRLDKKKVPQDILNFKLNWDGDGTIYFDDVAIKAAQ